MTKKRKKPVPIDWKDVARRAFKTAGQTFFSMVTFNALLDGFNPDILETALVSAGGAGGAILWNTLQDWFFSE